MMIMTKTTNNNEHIVRNIVTVSVKGYFVYAKTISGARFLSELTDHEEAVERFDEYGGMVSYFGGGIVQLYGVLSDNSDVVFEKDQVFY